MIFIEAIYKVIACHLIGDYVLQADFIAKTKGCNWYHLLVHCLLYVLPFYICFGFDSRIAVLLVTHFAVDASKARWNIVDYFIDQSLHYWIALIIYIG